MKALFEIPELAGKTWSERSALIRKAEQLDRRIFWRRLMLAVLTAVILLLLVFLLERGILPSLWWVIAIYLAVSFPIIALIRSLWLLPVINEAVRRAKQDVPPGK